MDDYQIKAVFWFLTIALIANRLILRFYYKRKLFDSRKSHYEYWQTYYLGLFHATLMALGVVSLVGN
jgi:hypothetical protein